jgi:hypothetical protein
LPAPPVRDFKAMRVVDAVSSAPRRRQKFNVFVYSELKVDIVVWPEAKVIIVVRPEAKVIIVVRPEAETFEPGWHMDICVPPKSLNQQSGTY